MTATFPSPDPVAARAEMNRQWRTAMANSRAESAARRARVLAHEDLAKRLTEPPLRLSNPQRWSGWIPPRTLAEDTCAECARDRRACRGRPHLARVNDSPYRRALVEIAAEALRRETAADAAGAA